MSDRQTDVVIVGAGHNGLVAAIFLLRAGLSVRIVESQNVVGGAARTERPFARAPNLPQSTGAYLLGPMPPELVQKLGIDLPLVRRDPHYFLPTEGAGYLLFGSDREATRAQFESFFSTRDREANEALERELAMIRDDIAPSVLEEPVTIEETADKYVRPALRRVFVDLCRGSIGAYLDRFGFQSDLVKAMYAVTDGFSGVFGTWDTPGTGMNFLAHNLCRLPGSDGTWMLVQGGMGTVTGRLAAEVLKLGGTIDVGTEVTGVLLQNGVSVGVTTAKEEIAARAVLVNADPFRMRELVGRERLPAEYNARLDGYRRDGSSLKVNLALSALPKFACLPDDRGQHRATTHLLPPEREVMRSLRQSFEDVRAGRLPAFPTIEWYFHPASETDAFTDELGRVSSALFVQWVPYEIAGSSWEAEEAGYVRHLLSICDRFAPGTSDLVVDAFALSPPGIERHFGITRGHIQHVDGTFGFADRLPYATPVPGLYSASGGTHPAGSVNGCAGHNAAHVLIRDLGIRMA